MKVARPKLMDIVIYTALVYVATVVLQIYQPQTGGYFNLGESMIYLAALTSTPLVAGIAGGVGAALADYTTGYAIFAPGTLVIKFAEGLIAGTLVTLLRKVRGGIAASSLGAVYAIVLAFYGVYMYSGEAYVGPAEFLSVPIASPLVNIPAFFWIAASAALGALMFYALYKKFVSFGESIALLTAGLVMVLGYFLYEYFISNPLQGREPIAAIAEVPINVAQCIIGIAIALPLASWLRRAGYAEGTERAK